MENQSVASRKALCACLSLLNRRTAEDDAGSVGNLSLRDERIVESMYGLWLSTSDERTFHSFMTAKRIALVLSFGPQPQKKSASGDQSWVSERGGVTALQE